VVLRAASARQRAQADSAAPTARELAPAMNWWAVIAYQSTRGSRWVAAHLHSHSRRKTKERKGKSHVARNMWVTVARSESSQRTSQSGWRRLRQRVLKRDGGECQIRGPRCLGDATVVDHITPVSFGGEDTEDNAQAVCGPCHDTKTARERAALTPRPSRKRGAPTHPADGAPLGG
jgi:5-methylcytosine-specific restriction enzyme A